MKIEGRLKSPEYVANITRVYRQALDRLSVFRKPQCPSSDPENGGAQDPQYRMEMAFSRGLYTGWFRGINNQELVHARFGKKRGVYLGEVRRVERDQVVVELRSPLKAGDGVVFDAGKPVAAIGACYAGSIEDAWEALKPLDALGAPLADLMCVASYTSLQTMLDAAWAPGFQNYWRAEYLRELPNAAADVLLDALHSITSPLSDFKVFTLGGAIARVPEEATAYSHRGAPLVLNINARWSDGGDSGRHMAWTRSLWDAMQPFSAGGGYTNWMGNEGPDRIRAAYGERKFERLVALKTRYDPTNFLRLNQNIPPSMLLRRERQYL